MSQAAHQDPRGFITPDAFEVSDALLGMPLASPRRRFAALMIDLMVIGFVTVVTSSFALVLGVVASIFFIRAGFKRTPVKRSVFNRAMRFSVGCFGVFLGLFTAALWGVFGPSFDTDDDDDVPAVVADALSNNPFASLAALGVSGVLESAFEDAETLEEAEAAVDVFADAAEELGVDRQTLFDFVVEAIPDDASWAEGAEERFSVLLGLTEEDPDADLATVEEEVAELSTEEALDAYAALLDEDDEEAMLRRTALQARLADEIAADTIAELADRIDDLESDVRRRDAEISSTQAELAEATSGGFWGAIMGFIDELGFGFGWASLYLTVFLSWWNGQTVGKKIMGVRVLRLDGEPITWWIAFERAGGYAAGFATGLLGFAQVWWDGNRQAIHDRIVGTVVVREGAPKVDDWEAAL